MSKYQNLVNNLKGLELNYNLLPKNSLTDKEYLEFTKKLKEFNCHVNINQP